MPKLTYRIANAPGKVYGKNSNELVFREPTSDALVYSTAAESQGLLKKSTKKQLFRGPPGEKEGGVCVATVDEPSATGKDGGSLEMHHHRQGGDEVTSTKITLKKTSSWVPFSGNNNHGLTFRDAAYTWSGRSQLKRDGDGKVIAKTVGPWFWQGKLGDLEVDVPEMGDEDERRELLEMVLASFVVSWWRDKVVEEEKAKEAKRKQAERKTEKQEQKKAVAAAAAKTKAKEAEEQKKKQEEEEESNKSREPQSGAGS